MVLAVDAMRQAFDSVRISGTVVIGEGEIDEALMLIIGEHVGAGPEVDIAIDPIEGTNLIAQRPKWCYCLYGDCGKRWLCHAPDMYMEKTLCWSSWCRCYRYCKSLTENILKCSG